MVRLQKELLQIRYLCLDKEWATADILEELKHTENEDKREDSIDH